jgi:hypothetical protein
MPEKIASLKSESDLAALAGVVSKGQNDAANDAQMKAARENPNYEIGKVDSNRVNSAREEHARRASREEGRRMINEDDSDEVKELKAQIARMEQEKQNSQPVREDYSAREMMEIANRGITNPESLDEERIQVVPLVTAKYTIGHKAAGRNQDGTTRMVPNEVSLTAGRPQPVTKNEFEVLANTPGILRGYK